MYTISKLLDRLNAHTHTHVHTRSQTEEERGRRKKGEDTNEKYQVSEEEITEDAADLNMAIKEY